MKMIVDNGIPKTHIYTCLYIHNTYGPAYSYTIFQFLQVYIVTFVCICSRLIS